MIPHLIITVEGRILADPGGLFLPRRRDADADLFP